MWLFYLAGLLFVVGIAGVFTGAGIFSLVLIPLALIAAGVAVFTSGSARAGGERSTRRRSRGSSAPSASNLPHEFPPGEAGGRTTTAPESLVDARLDQQ
jgi:hypothetical protein